MKLPPPPLLRGAFAPILFVLLAVSVNENAAAQGAICTSNLAYARNENPHSYTANGGPSVACDGRSAANVISSNPTRPDCGECSVHGPGCGVGDFPDDILYNFNGLSFCGPVAQCNAVQGTLVVGGTVCYSEPVTIHHQACYDDDFRTPIAISVFTGTPGAGDCRMAQDNDADKAICMLIDPRGSALPGTFAEVLYGACSVAANCPNASQPFIAIPDTFGDMESNDIVVGWCLSEPSCRIDHRRVGHMASNECRLATDNEDCAGISSSTPRHDTTAEDNCRAEMLSECDPNEVLTEGACTLCDASMHHVQNGDRTACECADTHENDPPNADPLNCMLLDCEPTETRADDGINCQPTTVDDCLRTEALIEGICTDCGTNAIRSSADNAACLCEPGHQNAGTGTNELPLNCELRDCGTGEVRASDGVSCEACEPHEFVENNACTECPANQIRGMDGSCVACDRNEVRVRGVDRCSCNQMTHYLNTADGTCDDFAECPGQVRQADNTCATNCGNNERLESGACECIDGHSRVAGGSCERNCSETQIRVNNAGECVDRVACAGGTVSPANECTCPNNLFRDVGACVPFIDPATECELNQIVDRSQNTCQNCGENEVRGADEMCECQQFGEVGNCVPLVEVSTCAPNEHIVGNACAECPVNQFRGTGSSCAPCLIENETREEGAADCSCPDTHYDNREGGTCDPLADCGEQVRQADNTCAASCGTNERLEDGSCECIDGHSRVAGGSCERNCSETQIRVNNAGECVDRVACAGGTVSPANECMCPNTHENINGTCLQSCHADASRQGTGCRCNADYEGDGFSCAACENGQTSEAGGACACPGDQRLFTGGCAVPQTCDGGRVLGRDNVCTDNCPGSLLNISGVCEESREGTCETSYEYDETANRCVCPQGERENDAMTACEAIPAASSGGGGGGGGGGGAAAAIIAVPVVLIGGYYLLGGFGYADPYADFNYSGENGNLEWHGDTGINLQHGDFASYVSAAVRSNGESVGYKSGISYERDFIFLTYDAAESGSEYQYDFGASAKAEFGPWTIAPAAVAEFQYRDGEFDSDASAGVSATWAAHRWNMRAQSEFSGDAELGLELLF